jgi:hypothetical protein
VAGLNENLIRDSEDCLEPDTFLTNSSPFSIKVLLGALPNTTDRFNISPTKANFISIKPKSTFLVSDLHLGSDGILVRVVISVLEQLEKKVHGQLI